MKKYIFAAAAAVAVLFTAGANDAKAQGIHFRSGGVHVDIGHPHRGHSHHGFYRRGWGGGRRSHGHWGGHGFGGGHRVWHDTTHLDYHPGGFVPHYDHYDYVPGHYREHYDGHWDHYGF